MSGSLSLHGLDTRNCLQIRISNTEVHSTSPGTRLRAQIWPRLSVKVKCVPVHIMNTYRISTIAASLILSLGRKCVVNCTFRPLCPGERTLAPTKYETGWALDSVWEFLEKRNSVANSSVRTPVPPACSLVSTPARLVSWSTLNQNYSSTSECWSNSGSLLQGQ
jgi:hypothetical protein